MTRNFDQFCYKFLFESSRNSWNPERFMRVVPRDLFNEAKILSMVSKFAKDVNQGKMPGGFIGKLNKKWTVALSENGELYISGFDLTYKGQKADLTMNYNAGKMYRFPLQITVENMDLWSVSIYDENGELDSDMRQFEEAPGPGKIDIPDWSLTIEELKRLGKIGLNNNLNDDSGIIPKDDSRGFADSFSNGKIGNIKINKNIIENFDQFCSRFLYESVSDDEYLKLASDPEKNREELQMMVNEAAKYNKYQFTVFRADELSFTIFDKSKADKNAHALTLGIPVFHASSSKYVAGSYAGNVRRFHIKITDPAIIDARGKQWDETVGDVSDAVGVYHSDESLKLAKLQREFRLFDFMEYDDLTPQQQSIIDKAAEDAEKIAIKNSKTQKKYTLYDGFIINNSQDIGIKGLAGNETSPSSNIYGVFDPSQIKSADPVTYDDSGNIIPLSQRFDSSKEDIRY